VTFKIPPILKKPFISIPIIAIAFILATLLIQHKLNDDYKDPTKIGLYFTEAIIRGDKEEAKLFSYEKIHSRLKGSFIDDDPLIDDSNLYMTNYKRVGNRIVATYSYIDLEKAWHYTLVLAPIKESTWYEKLRKFIFVTLPFGDEIITLPLTKDRYLVIDFYTKSLFNIDEYNKLISEDYKLRLKQNTNETFKSWDNQLKKEGIYYESFTKQELLNQYEETQKIINDYLNSIFQKTNSSHPTQNGSSQTGKLKEVKTSEVNSKELEEYYQTYKNPFVIYLREVLNAYLNNDITKVNITTNALKKTSDENFIRGLEAFDKEYYKSKFVVLTFTEHKAKGVELRIMFQDKPDRIFDAWIYRFADGDFELRGFASDENYDPVKIKELNNTYKQFLLDKKHAI